jgi:hypothetical protein
MQRGEMQLPPLGCTCCLSSAPAKWPGGLSGHSSRAPMPLITAVYPSGGKEMATPFFVANRTIDVEGCNNRAAHQ